MARTHKQPTQHESFGLDEQALVAHLLDEAEHWKAVAQNLEAVIADLRFERDVLRDRGELGEVWRQGLAAELLDLADARALEPRRKIRVLADFVGVLLFALALWALIGLLAFGAYRLMAG